VGAVPTLKVSCSADEVAAQLAAHPRGCFVKVQRLEIGLLDQIF
jgi:hypothetical protein